VPDITEYSAAQAHQSLFVLFKNIGTELCRNRWLLWQLFKRDFTAGYKQYFFGLAWNIFLPASSIFMVLILNGSGVFDYGTIPVPYPVFAASGFVFWQFLTTGIVFMMNSLANAQGMIAKINFCKKALVIASLGQAVVSLIIQTVLLFVLLVLYKQPLGAQTLIAFVCLLPLALLVLGAGFLLSLLNFVVKDTALVVSFGLAGIFLLTPVLYASPDQGMIAVISRYNPVYYLVCYPREILLFGTSSLSGGYWASCAGAFFVFVFGITTFHGAEKIIAERT
jgi:lipopolysaccharide transport system permease protein